MFRLTSKPLVVRLLLLIGAMLVLAALAYGLRIHVVGDPPARDLTIVDGTATATAPRPAPGPTPVIVAGAPTADRAATTHGDAAPRAGEALAHSTAATIDLP